MSISSEEGIFETAAPRLGIHGITAPAQEHKRLSCTDATAFRPGLTQPTNFLASRPNSQRGSSTSPYTKQQPLNLVPLARGPRTPLNQAQGATLSLQLTTRRRREQRPARLSARKDFETPKTAPRDLLTAHWERAKTNQMDPHSKGTFPGCCKQGKGTHCPCKTPDCFKGRAKSGLWPHGTPTRMIFGASGPTFSESAKKGIWGRQKPMPATACCIFGLCATP